MINEMKTQIRLTLSTFKQSEELFEIRLLHAPKGVISGYFRNNPVSIAKLLVALSTQDLTAYSIYVTLNPPMDACIARSDSKLTPYAKTTTKDSDIERIQWMHVDLDPKRPAGVQATQAEVDHAEKKALEIRAYLDSHGITDPVFSFSGNGFNLDYRIDVENSKENVSVLKSTLKHLADTFTDDNVDVDLTTYNPARIVKLFGCLSCKGENTPERPYRYSRIISAPKTITVNDISRIKA